MFKKLILALFFILSSVYASKYETVSIAIDESQKVEASYFHTKGDRATIFVPGKIFDKTSWHFLAKSLQKDGISSLSIDGKYPAYVLKSIQILKDKGYSSIYLVGGSMGGAAVLNSMKGIDPVVKKVIVLAPFGGEAIKNKSIDKLFVVAKDDFMAGDTYFIHKNSDDKKRLVEYDSSEHAQHLFKGKYKDQLTELILEFLKR